MLKILRQTVVNRSVNIINLQKIALWILEIILMN